VEEKLKKRDELRTPKEQLLGTNSGWEPNCISGTSGSIRFSLGSVGGSFSVRAESSGSYIDSYSECAPFAASISSSQSPPMLPPHWVFIRLAYSAPSSF